VWTGTTTITAGPKAAVKDSDVQGRGVSWLTPFSIPRGPCVLMSSLAGVETSASAEEQVITTSSHPKPSSDRSIVSFCIQQSCLRHSPRPSRARSTCTRSGRAVGGSNAIRASVMEPSKLVHGPGKACFAPHSRSLAPREPSSMKKHSVTTVRSRGPCASSCLPRSAACVHERSCLRHSVKQDF